MFDMPYIIVDAKYHLSAEIVLYADDTRKLVLSPTQHNTGI